MKDQKAKMKEDQKGNFEKEKLKILKGNCNFRPGPGQMALLECLKGQNERK